MNSVNNEQMKALVTAFMERISSGAPIDSSWRSRAVAIAPELPDHPTPEQIEAWTELASMLQDEDVIREFQTGVSSFWDGAQDAAAYRAAAVNGYNTATEAIARGLAPTGSEGIAAGRAWLDAAASAMGRPADADFVEWLQDQYAFGGSRGRFQELLAVLKGDKSMAQSARVWRWLIDSARAATQKPLT